MTRRSLGTTLALVLASACVVACAEEPASPPAGPGGASPQPNGVPAAAATAAPADPAASASSPPAQSSPAPPLAPPVMAKLVELTSAGTKVPVGSRCDVLYVAVAKGNASVAGQSLAQGDVLMVSHFAAPGTLDLKGSGTAFTITAPHGCPPGSAPSAGPLAVHVARAADTKDLSWANGAMHAHLDLEKDISPDVYVGRIEGTAPVAEHDHASSWEILCATESSGTFTLDGAAQRINGPQIIAVPPGRKHSWQPDAGTKLVAVQVYAPPGPEQRFKALAGH